MADDSDDLFDRALRWEPAVEAVDPADVRSHARSLRPQGAFRTSASLRHTYRLTPLRTLLARAALPHQVVTDAVIEVGVLWIRLSGGRAYRLDPIELDLVAAGKWAWHQHFSVNYRSIKFHGSFVRWCHGEFLHELSRRARTVEWVREGPQAWVRPTHGPPSRR